MAPSSAPQCGAVSSLPSPAPAQAVWVAAGDILEYGIAQLKAGGAVSPIERLCVGGAGAIVAAFDASGNLWIVNITSLEEYSASQLAALRSNDSPTPVVTITSSTPLAGAVGLAFDPAGNLWVAASSGLHEFSAAQLSASGSKVPAVSLQPCAVSHGFCATLPATRLTFDATKNLWFVTGVGVGGTGAGEETAVYELSHASIGASGSPTPVAQFKLQAPAPSGSELLCSWNDISFDPSGNLWVAFFGIYYEFTKAQLATTGPTPALAINLYGYTEGGTNDGNFTVSPSSIALDASGDVFAYAGGGPLRTMTPAQYHAATPSSTSDSGPAVLGITVGPYHP